MKQKGFTLIELLAVIVILAIIALIATPIILGLISESKKQGNIRSAELYMDAVRQSIARKNMTTRLLNATCIVNSEGNLNCDGKEVLVEVANTKATGGTIYLENGVITHAENLLIGGSKYNMERDGKFVLAVDTTPCKRSTDNDGFSVITCKTEKFYVLSEDSNTVTMLAAKNITLTDNPVQSDSAGTISFADEPYWNNIDSGIDLGNTDYIYNENSNLYNFIDKYRTSLTKLGITVNDARLLSYDEANNMDKYFGDAQEIKPLLNFVTITDEDYANYNERIANATEDELNQLNHLKSLITNFNTLTEDEQVQIIIAVLKYNIQPNELYNWQYNPSYWLGTIATSYGSNDTLYAIQYSGDILDGWAFMNWAEYTINDTLGIRPVIVIPTSNIS